MKTKLPVNKNYEVENYYHILTGTHKNIQTVYKYLFKETEQIESIKISMKNNLKNMLQKGTKVKTMLQACIQYKNSTAFNLNTYRLNKTLKQKPESIDAKHLYNLLNNDIVQIHTITKNEYEEQFIKNNLIETTRYKL